MCDTDGSDVDNDSDGEPARTFPECRALNICFGCGQPLLPGQGIHAASRMHWDCHLIMEAQQKVPVQDTT